MLWGWDRTGPYGWVNVDRMEGETRVVDGRRVTYQVDEPAVTVWLFGGSTAFGVGQRQDFTIASRMVREAEERGVGLCVENFGVSGYVNEQETSQFIDALKSGDPPDLAVFLDGANDTALGIERETVGLLDIGSDHRLSMSDEQREALAESARANGYKPRGDLDVSARLAAAQYERGVRRARAAAEVANVPVVFFWQPQLYTMPLDRPLVTDALDLWHIDRRSQPAIGRAVRAIADLSGVGPVDLTHVFDQVDEPIFFDRSHTNERGAELTAGAMMDELWPLIREAHERHELDRT